MFNDINLMKKLSYGCLIISLFSLCICLTSLWITSEDQVFVPFLTLGLYALFWILAEIFRIIYVKLLERES